MDIQFYFYTDNNTFSDYLSTRIIACHSVIGSKLNSRTVSNSTDDFLFVTHLKLDRKTREIGTLPKNGIIPVTLGFVFDKDLINKFPVILIEKSIDSTELKYGDIKDYDESKNIGAFIPGEIPFTFLNSVIFDNDDEKNHLYRPSDDYWYPEKLYRIASDEEFNDIFTNDLCYKTENDELWKYMQPNRKGDLLEDVKRREKHRAAALGLILSTKNWKTEDYCLNIDHYLQNYFKIPDEFIKEKIPDIDNIASGYDSEKIDIMRINRYEDNENDVDEKFYEHIFESFVSKPSAGQISSTYFGDLYSKLYEKFTELKKMTEVKQYLDGSSFSSIEKILSSVPEKISSVKAYILVSKNPDDFCQFSKGVELYSKNDQITNRRAYVLWLALNGLCFVPGSGFDKDNIELWKNIDIMSSIYVESPMLCSFNPDVANRAVKVECRERFTKEEVQNKLKANNKWITDTVINQMIDQKFINKNNITIKKFKYKENVQIQRSKGEIVSDEEHKKDCKNSKKCNNGEYIISYDINKVYSFVCDEKKFSKMFKSNKKFFVDIIKSME